MRAPRRRGCVDVGGQPPDGTASVPIDEEPNRGRGAERDGAPRRRVLRHVGTGADDVLRRRPPAERGRCVRHARRYDQVPPRGRRRGGGDEEDDGIPDDGRRAAGADGGGAADGGVRTAPTDRGGGEPRGCSSSAGPTSARRNPSRI